MSWPTALGLLRSGEGILPWLFTFVLLHWDPGMKFYYYIYISNIWGSYLFFSLLGGCSVLWLLLAPLGPRQEGDCGVPGREASKRLKGARKET